MWRKPYTVSEEDWDTLRIAKREKAARRESKRKDFPGDPVEETLYLQHRGCRFDPSQGAKISHATEPGKNIQTETPKPLES